ncbi:membrane protein [Bacillus sp. SA1-12]|nr:membrane protein [Bacillus sp. SA1-12]
MKVEFSFGFIVSIAIAIYLAIDAPKHNKNPWLWGILGFIFGPIVLGIYLIRTGRKVAGWIIFVISVLLIILFIILFGIGMFFLFNSM